MELTTKWLCRHSVFRCVATITWTIPCSEEDVWLMAVCEIWDVKGRLDHPIDYAENAEKTANPKYTDADF